MRHQSLLTPIALGVLSLAASAQSALTPTKITAPIKDRGVYHVATGTWSRATPATSINSDVLFNNNALVGYFFPTTSGLNIVDHGRLPSTSSPTTPDSVTGTADTYTIDCFTLAYCSSIPAAAGGVDVRVRFYDDYAPCSDLGLMGGHPTVSDFTAVNLPSGTTAGVNTCWIVTFDLANTTATFTLGGDADGIWDDLPSSDSFGWGLNFTNSTGSNGTGPLTAGNCPVGGVTSPQRGFQTVFGGTPGGSNSTGLGTSDFFWVDSPLVGTPASPNGGCFFFGGCIPPGMPGAAANPYASFFLQLFGPKSGGPDTVGTSYCSSLINATGSAAVLTAVASDTSTDLVLTSQPVPNTTGQFFFGPMALLGTQSLGDGLRCVGGMTDRLLPFITAGMMMQAANSVSFTVNYTAPYAAGLTGIKHFQHWFREPAGTSTTGSNTSTGISIAF